MTLKIFIIHIAYSIGLFLGLSSCSNTAQSSDSKEIAKEENKQKFDQRSEKENADFLVSAAEISLKEIQLGKLAQSNAVGDEVRDLGKTMELDHEKSLASLKTLAEKKQIATPGIMTQKGITAYDKLSKKSAQDFDKAYTDLMMKDHKDAIELFEDAATNTSDQEIGTWLREQLVMLHEHLDHAKELQDHTETAGK